MHDLTDAAAMSCVCFVPSGDDVVVADIIQPVGGRRGTLGLRVGDEDSVGTPPLGSVLVAWTGPDRRDQWYRIDEDDLGIPVELLSATYDPVLALIRERGYSVECLDPPAASVADAISGDAPDRGGPRPPAPSCRSCSGSARHPSPTF